MSRFIARQIMIVRSTFLRSLLALAMALTVNAQTGEEQAEKDERVDNTQIQGDLAERNNSVESTAKQTVPNLVDTVVIIPRLDFQSTALSDLLTAMARAYNLSLYVDSSVTDRVSIRLDNVTLNDALLFIFKEYGLSWERIGGILKIYREKPPPPELPPLDLSFANNLLSLNLDRVDIARFVDTLIDLTSQNIILEGNARGAISGRLSAMELEKALQVILPTNGFTFKKIDDVIYVGITTDAGQPGSRTRNLLVRCTDGIATLDVTNSPLSDVVIRLASECGVSILLQTTLDGNITASFTDRTFENALTYLLLNTAYTFKESSGVYFVGSRESQDLYVSKLVTLENLIASNLQELIPTALANQLSVKVVKEHNGLLLTGPITTIARVEDFIRELDVPTAQVLFDVIVVDYLTTENFKFALTATDQGLDSLLPGEIYYPGLDISGTGPGVNRNLNSLERRLSISNLGTVGADFFARLQWLQSEGKADVRSRPQIAALNGNPASIRIGQTQYFLLESETTYLSQTSTTQSSQRFETIEADLSLEVTPFVNSNNELTVLFKLEFNTPTGQLSPDIPPTINRRELNSTIRLRNGETIVLGGLIQSTRSETIDRVPLLSSIPLIGKLFQNRTTTDQESELMIYITPYVYYGSEGSITLDDVLER